MVYHRGGAADLGRSSSRRFYLHRAAARIGVVLLGAAVERADAQCRTEVGDCYGISVEDCVGSFDRFEGYRACAVIEGSCDGVEESAASPTFEICSGGNSPVSDPTSDSGSPAPAPPQLPDTLCDPAPPQESCTEFDTDGDGVKEAFPAWIAEPITVTLPSGASVGDSVDVTLASGQVLTIAIPDVDLSSTTFEYPLLTRDCLVFCEDDAKKAECCASFFGGSYIEDNPADPWGRWSSDMGSERIYQYMRPLPGIQSSAGSTTATCKGHSCSRAWYWAGLFEPPSPGDTTYTLTFRKGEVADSWYGGYSSRLDSVKLALVPVSSEDTLESAFGADASRFWEAFEGPRAQSTNDCRLNEYPVLDCGLSAGYTPGTAANPSTTCPEGCRFVEAVGDEPETCTSRHFPSNGVCDVENNMCRSLTDCVDCAGRTIDGELQDCFEPCELRRAVRTGAPVVHGEQIVASECTPYEIVFDYARDLTEITVNVPGTGRFALLVKDQRWTAHLEDSDECEEGNACHYVSVGDTPVWPSSSTFANSCSESVKLEDGTWQTGTCPDGSCGLGGQCGGTPRKCSGNSIPDDDIVCPDPSVRIGCYDGGKPVPFSGGSCGGLDGGHTEQCCMVVGRCAGNTDGDQNVKCPEPTRLKQDKCVAINPAWDTGQTRSYLAGLHAGSLAPPPAEYERICAAVQLTGDPKTFSDTCADISYEDELGTLVEGVCGHAYGQYWLQTGANNGMWIDQKQDVSYCCELEDPGALPGYGRPTSGMGFGEQLQIYHDNVRNIQGAPDNPYKIGMIMLQWADTEARDLPHKEVVQSELFEGANRDYMRSVSGGKFSFEPVFYGETGWIPIDTPEISTASITAPWGPEEPQCFQKIPLDICIAEHAIKCRDASSADCLGDDPEKACLIAGAPVEAGASTASGTGYVGDGPIAWFNSYYVDGDSGNELIDAANNPVALSACQFIPGDGTKGSSSCVAKETATCEAFETTAGRYNRDGDNTNPETLADPAMTCENLGPSCVYRQASFPDYGNYKPLVGVTEAECLADTAHETNRFGHKKCHFNFDWRNAFSECNDGELYGYRSYCYQCVVTAPEVPSCLRPAYMSEDECNDDVRCENGFLRTTFDNSAAESRLTELTLSSGEVLNSIDGWERSDGIPASPVADDWLTWAAGVDKAAECQAYDDDGDGSPDGVYGIAKCAELAPMEGEGPWLQDNLAIPGFDPTAIDGVVIIAPAPRCAQRANAGVRTLKVFNAQTNEHTIYKFPGSVMSFNAPSEVSSCSEPNYDPFCSGGSATFIHELIHQLGVGFHAYGPGFYDDGECTAEFRDCPFARYGNIMSIMGPSNGPGKELDAHLRYYLFWLNLDEVVVIRRDGQYTINPIADPSAPKRAAQILLTSGEPPEGYSHPDEWGQFWLEYRRAIGFDIGLGSDEFMANTQGLVIAAGSTVIDATTGQTADWKQISFNTQWEDPYSGLAITIDSMNDDSITFTVSGMCPSAPCPTVDDERDQIALHPSPVPSSPPAGPGSNARISLSLTLDIEYSRTWNFQFMEIGYPAGSMAEATAIFDDVCVDDKTDSTGRHAPTGGKYTTDFFANDVAASISSLLGIPPGISCTPSVHVGTHSSCIRDQPRVHVKTVQPGAAAATTLVSFDVLADPLTGEQMEPIAVANALVAPNLIIAGHNVLGDDCVGAWSTCGADCGDKTYTIIRPASSGGAVCSAEDRDTVSCSPGEGECLVNIPNPQPEEPGPQPEEPDPQPEQPNPQPEEPNPHLTPDEGSGVQVAVTLTISIDSIPEGSNARANFEADIVSELAAALDIPQSRVRLLSVRAGSVVITFEILPPDSASDPNAVALAQAFESLVDDANSAIYTSGSVLADIDAESLVLQAHGPVSQPSEDDDLNATGILDKASGATTASTTVVAVFGYVIVMLLQAQYRRI